MRRHNDTGHGLASIFLLGESFKIKGDRYRFSSTSAYRRIYSGEAAK